MTLAISQVRYRMNEDSIKAHNPLRQYYNTPSCHDLPNERPFYER